jgi:hypothetical protein
LAQTTGATLQGTVTDPSGLAVPGVTVELKNVATGVARTTTANPEGVFRFNGVQPAVYDMTIRPGAGFREYVQRQITLNASQIRDLGRINLTLGTLAETVEVTAIATPVQTASSENASMVDFNQMSRVTVRGRDLMSLLQTIPGANFGTNFLTGGSSGQGNYETVNPFALGALNLNGQGSAANYTVDGVTGMDSAGDSLTTFSPNVDAVAEVRVLATNYAAEYGRNVGGQIQVVTKSGGMVPWHLNVNSAMRCSTPIASSTTTTATRRIFTGSWPRIIPSAARSTSRACSTPRRTGCSSSCRRNSCSRDPTRRAATPT